MPCSDQDDAAPDHAPLLIEPYHNILIVIGASSAGDFRSPASGERAVARSIRSPKGRRSQEDRHG
jgi:hypothetical protein